jgi:hypothetical protein
MPLYLVTSLYDEGISAANFRVVEAASKRDIAVHMLEHPEQWAFFLRRSFPRDWRGAGPHLGSLLDCTHDLGMTPERFLELIDMTWVDGDSAAQLAIHEITVSPLAAVHTQPQCAGEAEQGTVMHQPREF